LKSLKKYGLVEDFWVQAGGRPRKSYKLTSLGEEVLKELKSEVLEIIRIAGGVSCE
ncbi:PadR family transcriptional regulator, partial [Thermococci archaeon]